MNQRPLQIQVVLTLPPESLSQLAEIVETAVAKNLQRPPLHRQHPATDTPKRLLPHQSKDDLELEDGVHLLVDTKQACKLLKVSRRTLYIMTKEKRMPEPIRLGGTFVRWSLAELIQWVEHGCPPQSQWKYPPRSSAE